MNKFRLLKPEEAARRAKENVAAFKCGQAREALEAKRGLPAQKDRLNTLLMQSAEKGKLDEVGRLLKAGADVNAKCEHGWTALMYAAREGHMEVIELLITNGADVNAANSSGWTALNYAAMKKRTRPMKRHKEIAELLKKYGATE